MADDEYSVELPVLEEFIPQKPISSSGREKIHKVAGDDSKPDWLRSVRLWAQPPAAAIEMSAGEISNLRKPLAKIGGAFHLFEKEKSCRPPASEAHESSTIPKHRRCWSPELHRKFLNALEQLGGSQSATPKQIKELMKVERLTNDDVKSHLQKYRLQTRQSSTAIQGSSCISPQTPPQFVFVRGIWVPPPDYVESFSAFNGTYSSVQSVALDCWIASIQVATVIWR